MIRTRTNNEIRQKAVKEIMPLTGVIDANFTLHELEEYLDKYSHEISVIHINLEHKDRFAENRTRKITALAHRRNVPTVTTVNGVLLRGALPMYMEMCAAAGATRIQFNKDNINHDIKPRDVVQLADECNLDVHFEIENLIDERRVAKEESRFPFSTKGFVRTNEEVVREAEEWIQSGTMHVVVESSLSLSGKRRIQSGFAEILASAFGLHTVMFKAPTQYEQEGLLSLFGGEAHLCEVPLKDVKNVEMLRGNVAHHGTVLKDLYQETVSLR